MIDLADDAVLARRIADGAGAILQEAHGDSPLVDTAANCFAANFDHEGDDRGNF